MQHRMKEFTMKDGDIKELLEWSEYGHISTICGNGYPYTVAVHYVYVDNRIYIHGLPKGQKIDNIENCSKVCFTVDEMTSLMLEDIDSPCKADTEYESVVIFGDASIVSDLDVKNRILNEFVRKYIPDDDLPIPPNMLAGTAVIEIQIKKMTGKYHS